MRHIISLACLVWGICACPTFAAELQHPDCSGRDHWPAAMTGVRLKELGLSEKAGGYDNIEVELLASDPFSAERHGRPLFQQVHKVTITDGGRTFTAITVNTASFEECSESGGDVFIVDIAGPSGAPGTPSRPPQPTRNRTHGKTTFFP